MIFAIDFRFGHDKDVVKQEFAEIRQMVTLPIFYSVTERLDGSVILSSTLGLVDLVCDAFGRVGTLFQFVVMRVVGRRRCFDQ